MTMGKFKQVPHHTVLEYTYITIPLNLSAVALGEAS